MPTATSFSAQCPSCETWFPIDPERVPDEGVSAICSSCMRVFRVERPEADIESVVGTDPVEGEPAKESGSIAPTGRTDDPPGAVETPDREDPVDEFEVVEETVEVVETEEFVEVVETEEVVQAEPIAERVEVEDTEERAESVPASGPAHVEDPEEIEEGERSTTEPTEPEEIEETTAPSPVQDQSLSQAVSRFGRRDPHDRAKRLARVLVSDMLTYHPARYEEAIAGGTLREDFDEEVRRSWEEYEEQIGTEIAGSTDYFIRALNEILANGETLYRGTGRPD